MSTRVYLPPLPTGFMHDSFSPDKSHAIGRVDDALNFAEHARHLCNWSAAAIACRLAADYFTDLERMETKQATEA